MVVGHVDDILVALHSEYAMNSFFDSLAVYLTIERKGKPKTLLAMDIQWGPGFGVQISGA